MLLFFWQAGKENRLPWLRPVLLTFFAVATWVLVYNSGVHATIAGVALGLVMKPKVAETTVHNILPFNNAVVLPLFAFVSALVVIPNMPLWQMSAVFFGILIALNLQTSFLSPPVAMAAFYLKGVAPPHVSLNQIFVGMLPFMVIQPRIPYRRAIASRA